MEFIGILFALFYAVILTAVFSLFFRNTGPWSGFWVFFILLFFVALGAGEWAAPRGPVAWGYYWAPGLFAAIIFALLLAATSASNSSHSPNTNKATKNNRSAANVYEAEKTETAMVVFGIFFWILISVLFTAAVVGILAS